ncbi:MAG: preprotein translocase subunit SecE [Clostridiales bacterium]|nr:preprotein translocase subunit SecE [Clostridiales bacterium]
MGESKDTPKTGKLEGFFNGVKAEFKKVVWPDKQSLLKQSVAVVWITVVLGLVITLIDTILQYGINFLSM